MTGRGSTTRPFGAAFGMLASVFAPLVAASPAGAATASAVSPYVKVQPGTRPAAFSPNLVAPKGGAAMFQIVLRGVAAAPRSAAAVGGVPAAWVDVKAERWIRVRRHSAAVPHGQVGLVPDPLVPVSRARPAAGMVVLRIRIRVPRTAPAGRRGGAIRVAVGGRTLSVPFRLRVSGVRLPARAFDTWLLIWGSWAQRAEGRDSAPQRIRSLLTSLRLGDSTGASGGAVNVFSATDTARRNPGAAAKLAHRRAVSLWRRSPGRAAYSYVFDEPRSSGDARAVARYGQALARSAPRVRQFVTSAPRRGLDAGRGAIYAMHLQDLTAARVNRARAGGGAAWAYSSCCERGGDASLLLDQRATGNLAVAPATWMQGGKGLFYWGVTVYEHDPWRQAEQPLDGSRVSNGDGVLVYPGRSQGLTGPVSSLRLELTAAGVQIVDLAAMLAHRGRAAEARRILRPVLPGTARFNASASAWLTVEQRLIAALERP